MFDPFARMRNLQRQAGSLAGALPRRLGRQRGSRFGSLPAMAVAGAGLATIAGLLLWDDRRRAAMRQRLVEVTGSIGASANRVAEPLKTGARPD